MKIPAKIIEDNLDEGDNIKKEFEEMKNKVSFLEDINFELIQLLWGTSSDKPTSSALARILDRINAKQAQ